MVPTHEQEVHTSDQKTISRRQLLKALLAAGGAVSVSTILPNRWEKPLVDVGVLPVHAQISGVITVTPTPRVTHAINSITFINPDTNSAFFVPGDQIRTYANIVPVAAGVPLRATIILQQASHPQDGVVARGTRLTRDTGRTEYFDFDTSTLVHPVSPGFQRYRIIWEFENSGDGWNSLEGFVDIMAAQS